MFDPNELENANRNPQSDNVPEETAPETLQAAAETPAAPIGEPAAEPVEAAEAAEAAVIAETAETAAEPVVQADAPVQESSPFEYRFVRSDPAEPGYADARYSTEPQTYQPRYHSSVSEPEKPAKKSPGKGFWAAAVAMCLVCALLGGLVGGVVVSRQGAGTAEEPVAQAATETSLPAETGRDSAAAQPETTSTPILHVTTDGNSQVLPATEIYNIACSQVVGVTTEITYTSFFGTSTAAVSGSGFIVSEDGYILTNYHVIEDAYKGGYDITVLLYNNDSYSATIVGFEEDNDVAVLKIDAEGLNPVSIADSDSILVGETVYAVGNPLGELIFTMTTGSVSALNREITNTDPATGAKTTINMFQIDAAVNSGNSGGPVYNARGEVIGIVTAKYSDTGVEGLGFAIPINDAVSIASELIEKGYVGGKAYFGITVQTVSSSVAQYYNMVVGAYIYALDPTSCAAEAGLQVGDIITKIDDTDIASSSDLISAKKGYRAGESARLTVYRSGEYVELTIVFDEEIPSSASVSSGDAGAGR